MGEARRRLPAPADELASLSGELGFTLNVVGMPPVTVTLDLADLDELFGEVAGVSPSRRSDPKWHIRQRRALIAMLRRGKDREDVALYALWLVLHTPREPVKSKALELIRKIGRAHIALWLAQNGAASIVVGAPAEVLVLSSVTASVRVYVNISAVGGLPAVCRRCRSFSV